MVRCSLKNCSRRKGLRARKVAKGNGGAANPLAVKKGISHQGSNQRIGQGAANSSVGLTINTVSRAHSFDPHSNFAGCLKPRCGDNNKRYSPRFTTPRSKLPSASVDTVLIVTCLASEMKRLSSIGECCSGAAVWSVIRPPTFVSTVSVRFGRMCSTCAQYSRLPNGGPPVPTTTTWPCAAPANSHNTKRDTDGTARFMP